MYLKDINLDIKSGETIGIIGGTGSAKTSLVNLDFSRLVRCKCMEKFLLVEKM